MQCDRQIELSPEGRELRRARRKVAEIVEPAFADGDDLRLSGKLGKLAQRLLVELGGMMGMNAGRAPETLRILANQPDGGARAGERAAGDHHTRHSGPRGAVDHLGAIRVEAVMGEIDSDVDELDRTWRDGCVTRVDRVGQWDESALDAAYVIVRTMNCSATMDGVVMRTLRGKHRLGTLGLLLVALAAQVARGETMAELDDAAVRMQYAFYTGDSRAIETVLKMLEESQVDSGLAAAKSYQLAYGNWKLSQIYLQPTGEERARPNAKSLAAKAAQTCARHAKRAVEQDATMAEALAIEAACEGYTPAGRAGAGGCATSKPLRAAASFAPDNPRIKLIQALCASRTAADPAAAERWRTVVASFEAAAPSRPGKPDWGHVEALTMLGETYLQRGDPVAARDALERALVIAPDYRQAQQLLQAAAARPR